MEPPLRIQGGLIFLLIVLFVFKLILCGKGFDFCFPPFLDLLFLLAGLNI